MESKNFHWSFSGKARVAMCCLDEWYTEVDMGPNWGPLWCWKAVRTLLHLSNLTVAVEPQTSTRPSWTKVRVAMDSIDVCHSPVNTVCHAPVLCRCHDTWKLIPGTILNTMPTPPLNQFQQTEGGDILIRCVLPKGKDDVYCAPRCGGLFVLSKWRSWEWNLQPGGNNLQPNGNIDQTEGGDGLFMSMLPSNNRG